MINYRSKEMALFYEKLAQLYRAGMPITESLPMASLDIKNGEFRHSVEKAQRYLMSGRTLTESFSQSPKIFSDLDLALIGIGETEGRLDQCLMNLSALYEKQYKDVKTFIFAMLYPTFLLLAAIFIPPLIDFFNSGPEAYARAVGSSIITFTWPCLLAYGIYYIFKNFAPEFYSQLLFAIPVLGTNLKKMALARFSRSFATLFSSGVDMRRSLRLSIKSLSNYYMQHRCRVIERALDEGRTIADGMRLANVFPANFVQTFALGEQTGDIDKMLTKVAEYYEFEADKAFKAILTMLPVFIYLCVAAYIGYIVISFYAGYYNAIGGMLK